VETQPASTAASKVSELTDSPTNQPTFTHTNRGFSSPQHTSIPLVSVPGLKQVRDFDRKSQILKSQ